MSFGASSKELGEAGAELVRHMNGGIVPLRQAFETRPSPVVGKLSTLLYVDGRLIAEQDQDGNISFHEDARRDELNAEIDRLRTQVRALEEELGGTRAFARSQSRTITQLEEMIQAKTATGDQLVKTNGNLGDILASASKVEGQPLTTGSGH